MAKHLIPVPQGQQPTLRGWIEGPGAGAEVNRLMRPTLDAALANPAALAALDRDDLHHLLVQCAAVQSAVVARLVALPAGPSGEGGAADDHDAGDDRLLSVDEAAAQLKRSRRWLYRQAKKLPFVIRVSPRSLLVSEKELNRWLLRRRAAR